MTTSHLAELWARRAALAAGGVSLFFLAYVQGEAGAIQRIANAASIAAPQAIAEMKRACPREHVSTLSAECVDLLPVLIFGGDTK